MRRLLCLFAASLACACSAGRPEFDLIIRGGDVYDGLSDTSRRVDVGIKGEQIIALGDLANRRAGEIIDATERVVAPGFIDANSPSSATLLADGDADSYVRQGITTVLLTDGLPDAPGADADDVALLQRFGVPADWQNAPGYLARLEQRGTSVNVAIAAPVATLGADGADMRLAEALSRGVFGLVAPAALAGGTASSLAAVIKRTNGVYLARLNPDEQPETAIARVTTALGAAQIANAALIVEPRRSEQIVPGELSRAISRQTGVTLRTVLNPYPADQGDAAQTELTNLFAYGVTMIGTFAPAARAVGALAVDARPSAFGAFPRVLGRYFREIPRPLGSAIHTATGLPAGVLRIERRGFVREGYYADLVVFDPNTLADQGTAENPSASPAGIDYVVVNGVVTVRPGGHTGARAGRGLVGPAARRPTGS